MMVLKFAPYRWDYGTVAYVTGAIGVIAAFFIHTQMSGDISAKFATYVGRLIGGFFTGAFLGVIIFWTRNIAARISNKSPLVKSNSIADKSPTEVFYMLLILISVIAFTSVMTFALSHRYISILLIARAILVSGAFALVGALCGMVLVVCVNFIEQFKA
jgi:hypothetical protein